jgi:DNA-binding response OmpR family regulator
MRESHFNPPTTSSASGRTNFTIVPITEVPALVPDAGKDRPVVLVVNKEPAIAETVLEILNKNGFAAIAAYDAKDALETALLIPPELVIAEVALPGLSGIEVATALKKELPDCKILLLAGQAEKAAVHGTVKAAGLEVEVVEKPVHTAELLAHVFSRLVPG